jgi:hypothetical protein
VKSFARTGRFASITLFTALFSTGAMADHHEDSPTPLTHYDQAAAWFAEGSPISFIDMGGMWSGRCFDKSDEMGVSNGLLLSQEVNDLGPGFESTKYMGIASHANYPVNYFDEYDVGYDAIGIRDTLNDAIAGGVLEKLSEKSGTTTWMEDSQPDGALDLKYTAVKHDDFIVVEAYNLIDYNTIYSKVNHRYVKNVRMGPWGYCYFFKQLIPTSN